MTPASPDVAVADRVDPAPAPPYPLLACWAIWIALSAGLWWAVWRLAALFL